MSQQQDLRTRRLCKAWIDQRLRSLLTGDLYLSIAHNADRSLLIVSVNNVHEGDGERNNTGIGERGSSRRAATVSPRPQTSALSVSPNHG